MDFILVLHFLASVILYESVSRLKILVHCVKGPFPHLPSNIVFAKLVSSREMLSSEFRQGDDESSESDCCFRHIGEKTHTCSRIFTSTQW